MTRIFADACYWIALLNRNDELHAAAVAARKRLLKADVVTTDEVLGEVLNFFSRRGPQMRAFAAQTVEGLRNAPRVSVIEQSRATFDGALAFYKGRSDREYSLVDCVSFALMRKTGINEALTNDHHFEQEHFVALLRTTDTKGGA
jgi:predicted nucleic acid-binding protein